MLIDCIAAVRWRGICYGDVAVCHVDVLRPNIMRRSQDCSPTILVPRVNSMNPIARGDILSEGVK